MKKAAAAIALSVCMLTHAARAEDRWWGPDKALHFGLSAAIAGGAYATGAALFDGRGERALFGGGIALGVGVSKELADAAGLGDPSFRDLAWDLLGVAVGIGLSLSIDAAVSAGDPRRSPAR